FVLNLPYQSFTNCACTQGKYLGSQYKICPSGIRTDNPNGIWE
ncbi:5640_t:CDS:1, partial [Scutellospora calospora]